MGKELVTKAKASDNVFALIQAKAPDFKTALSKAVDPERFMRVALTLLRTNAKLAQCDPMSVLGSLMTCAQLSLDPGPLGEAYLVPFGGEAALIIGYQGMIKLAYNSGRIASIYAEMIHAEDYFEETKGTSRSIVHSPPKFGMPRGAVIGVYAVAKF